MTDPIVDEEALGAALDIHQEDEASQIRALRQCAEHLNPQVNELLLDRIRHLTAHPSPNVRYHARIALDEIRARFPKTPAPLPDSLEAIKELLDSPNPDTRLKGVMAANRTRIPELFKTLIELLRRERDPWVKASLVKAVGTYQSNVSLPLLMKFLEDADGRVRANTVESLSGWQNAVVENRVAQMVDDPEHRVQAAVLTFLGRGGRSIQDRIQEMLDSDLVWLQASAIYVIGTLQPPWAIEILSAHYKKGIRDRRLRARVLNWIGVLERREATRAAQDESTAEPGESTVEKDRGR